MGFSKIECEDVGEEMRQRSSAKNASSRTTVVTWGVSVELDAQKD